MYILLEIDNYLKRNNAKQNKLIFQLKTCYTFEYWYNFDLITVI